MAELNEKQNEFYNSLISQGIEADIANKLTTGELTAADYKLQLEEQKPKDQKALFEAEGYDVELMTNKKKEIISKTKSATEGAAADDFSGESFMFTEYQPSKKDIVQSYGIGAEVKDELPKEIRFALGFSIANEDAAIIDAKRLYKDHLIKEKKYDKDLVESLDDKIQFKYQELKQGNNQNKTRVLTYKVPIDLGGTGKWNVTNSPTILPTGGDLAAITADSAVVAAAIGGGIGGSYMAPIAGTAAGSAVATGLAEYMKLRIGHKYYGLGGNMTEEEFDQASIKQALIAGAIDGVATPLFLKSAGYIKKAIMTSAMDKISVESIENIIKSGKLDDALIKNLDEAKAILKDNGIDEKLADEYLAVNVAKAFKNPALVPKDGALDSMTIKEGQAMAEKQVRINELEQKLIKKLSGLDDVNISQGQKDEIINDISARLKLIRQTELDEAAEKVALSEGKVNIVKRDLLPDPEISYIDNIGITFNDLNQGVKKQLGVLESRIDKGALKNNVRINVESKESIKILNKIIKDHNEKLTIKMKIPNDKNGLINNKEYMKKYQANQYVKTMEQTLAGQGAREEVVSVSQILKDGLKSLDDMSFKQAVTWRAILRGAENNKALPQPVLDAIRKVKGNFRDAIDDATSKNSQLANDVLEYDALMVNYRGSFLNQLSDAIGYGPKKAVTSQIIGRVGKNRSLFSKFIDDTDQSVDEAFRLKNIIDSGQLTVANTNKINNALYENYFNKVFPKKSGGKGLETHDEFIRKYGENYRLILGEEKYKKFVKSNKDALKVMDDAVNDQIKITNSISKALPGMPIETLRSGSSTDIVNQLLTKMRSNDVSQLVKNLSNSQEGLAVLKDTRKMMVQKMMTESYLRNANGQVLNGRMNGQVLDNFLTKNKEVLDQLFSKEFTSNYRQIANALRTLQDDSLLGTANALTITQAANTAGLFIDIFAGPLNHKRLIVNRTARILDKFNLGGDNINLLMDYKMAIEAAKKNFIGGNYPVLLDTLGSSSKQSHKGLLRKLLNSIGIETKYTGINKRTLLTKEYLKDKTNQDEKGATTFGQKTENAMPDEPDVMTAVDNILSTLGKQAKKDVIDRTGMLVKGFTKWWFKDDGQDVNVKEREFKQKLK